MFPLCFIYSKSGEHRNWEHKHVEAFVMVCYVPYKSRQQDFMTEYPLSCSHDVTYKSWEDKTLENDPIGAS